MKFLFPRIFAKASVNITEVIHYSSDVEGFISYVIWIMEGLNIELSLEGNPHIDSKSYTIDFANLFLQKTMKLLFKVPSNRHLVP